MNKLEIGTQITNIGRDCKHYGEKGTITEMLVADMDYGLYKVLWSDGKETVMLSRDMRKAYWSGYIYTVLSTAKDGYNNFPEGCVFHCLDGHLFDNTGRAGLYRFESFDEIRKRLRKSGIYVTEVKGIYDEYINNEE